MKPTHLTARNFRTYRDLAVAFPDGLFAILGEIQGVPGSDSNGAGKSSILEAVDIALFGRRSLAPYLTRGLVDDELLIELEFEHAGEIYRVRRTFNPRGRGKTTLDFEEHFDTEAEIAEWAPLTRESAKETQALIEQTIGLSRDTYRNSVYLRQGDGSFADPTRDPRERKQLLAEVLGLSRYDELRQLAWTDAKTVHDRTLALAARLEQAHALAATLPALEREHSDLAEAETVAADNVADLERSRAQLADEYARAREHAARLQAARAEWQAAHAAVEVLRAREAESTKAGGAVVLLRAEHATLTEHGDLAALQAERDDLAAQVAAHTEAVREREYAQRLAGERERERDQHLASADQADAGCETLRQKIQQLREADEPTCQTCGQALPDDARERAALSYADELVQTLAAAVDARAHAEAVEIPAIPEEPVAAPHDALAAVTARLADATVQQARRATLEERIRQLETQAASGPSPDELSATETLLLERSDAVTAIGDPPDLASIETQGRLVGEQLRSAQASLEQARTGKARVDERLGAARDAAEEAQAGHAEQQALQADADLLAALERAFSPNGIPALILENSAIPAIETDANRILVDLGCPYTIELRTQAALKSGDGVRDTLDVVVIDEHGQEAPFEECASGGEKTRIGLALRIALARLLAHRRGAESRALFLDEPSFLDEAGMVALLEVLRGLQSDFDLIALVSHIPALRDSFDTTLTVVKDDSGSRVVEQGVFEAVAA